MILREIKNIVFEVSRQVNFKQNNIWFKEVQQIGDLKKGNKTICYQYILIIVSVLNLFKV